MSRVLGCTLRVVPGGLGGPFEEPFAGDMAPYCGHLDFLGVQV